MNSMKLLEVSIILKELQVSLWGYLTANASSMLALPLFIRFVNLPIFNFVSFLQIQILSLSLWKFHSFLIQWMCHHLYLYMWENHLGWKPQFWKWLFFYDISLWKSNWSDQMTMHMAENPNNLPWWKCLLQVDAR